MSPDSLIYTIFQKHSLSYETRHFTQSCDRKTANAQLEEDSSYNLTRTFMLITLSACPNISKQDEPFTLHRAVFQKAFKS